MTRDAVEARRDPDADTLAEAQATFLAKLDEVEQLLGRHTSGPFFMGCA